MDPIQAALRNRYPIRAWALFFEVANGTGAYQSRYADALAMSLYPSRGLDLHGFEVKTDRQDWLNELKNPEKAETIAKFCDYWWLVIGSMEVAKKEEVPANWGILVMDGKRKTLRQVKKAKALMPKAIGRPFLAAILRRANEMAEEERRRADDKHSQDKAYRDAYEKGRLRGVEQEVEDVKIDTRGHESLKYEVAQFEKKSGIKIDQWSGGRLGEAVHALLYLREKNTAKQLEELAVDLDRVSNDFKKKAQALRSSPVTDGPAEPSNKP